MLQLFVRLARRAHGEGKEKGAEAIFLNEWIYFVVFCMFNIGVPLVPWETMAFEYAHNL